jgi:uncharacterized membrane protein
MIMEKKRIEAFADKGLPIIIAIMVPEFKVPKNPAHHCISHFSLE